MSIQFPPQSISSATASDALGQRAAPRAALTMAPVDLTLLAAPSCAPRQPVKAEPGQGLATEGRQAAFVERQQALLERLRQGGRSTDGGPGGRAVGGSAQRLPFGAGGRCLGGSPLIVGRS